MTAPLLTVRVDAGTGERLSVRAPQVGLWSHHPRAGAVLGPGSGAGFLDQLNRRFALVIPEGVTGRIIGALPKDRLVAVEFGELMFELAPVLAGDASVTEGERPIAGHEAANLAPGHHAVAAPTDGVFYRRPSPGAPAFVEVGDRIAAGAPLGLIEVMKTFSPIAYGGPGLPDEAEVVEVRVGDGVDIHAGQILIVVR